MELKKTRRELLHSRVDEVAIVRKNEAVGGQILLERRVLRGGRGALLARRERVGLLRRQDGWMRWVGFKLWCF